MQVKSLIIATTALSVSAFAQPSKYEQAKNMLKTVKSDAAEVAKALSTAPKSYNFESQFGTGSSVSYTGQVFRQVLNADLKTVMASQLRGSSFLTKEDVLNELLSFYQYDENTTLVGDSVIDGYTDFLVSAKDVNGRPMDIFEGFVYADIQSPGKNLYKKLAGVDNSLRRGKLYGTTVATTPADYVSQLFDEFAENTVNGKAFSVPNGSLPAQTIHNSSITADGRDLAQLTQKFFHGAISYSQAARDYLSTDLGTSKGLNADNSAPAKQGAKYTAMEHHFDEAFGYFGGARNFLDYSDQLLASAQSIDTDGDGTISLKSEMNLGIAKNFGRVDMLAADKDLDLTKEVMESFIKGRHLITQKPQGYESYVIALSEVALGAWEQTLAAVTVIYINLTIHAYEAYGTNSYLYKNFVKYWSEMKGFGLAFQFNPKGIMADTTFDQMHALMGDLPVLPHAAKADVDAYKTKLLQARDLLESTYGFSANNVANW